MSKQNYFGYGSDNPYHLSVGALVFNNEGKILVHRFAKELARNPFQGDIYTLIRETLEPHEPLETALERGLLEETGSQAELVCYLGPISGNVNNSLVEKEDFYKTTLYFAMKLTNWRPRKRLEDDREGDSELEWRASEEMIPIMREQGKLTRSADLDESQVIERFLDLKKRYPQKFQ